MNETEGRGRNGQYLPFLVAEGVVLSTWGFLGWFLLAPTSKHLLLFVVETIGFWAGAASCLASTSQHLASKVASLHRPNFY